jgi:hypothetical protein
MIMEFLSTAEFHMHVLKSVGHDPPLLLVGKTTTMMVLDLGMIQYPLLFSIDTTKRTSCKGQVHQTHQKLRTIGPAF